LKQKPDRREGKSKKAKVKEDEGKAYSHHPSLKEARPSSFIVDEGRAVLTLNFCLLPFAFYLLPCVAARGRAVEGLDGGWQAGVY
jgi:hypothetical protein